MWLDQPPKAEKLALTPLMRAKANQPIDGYLNGEPLRCFVHFAAGRSWPCTGYQCVLCKKQITKRCYAYYPVCNSKGQAAIFELTAQAESQLLDQMSKISDVPCGHMSISRPPGRRNLPCTVKWVPSDPIKKSGNRDVDVKELQKSLMRIWKLPQMNGTSIESEYLAKLNEVIRLKTEHTH